MKNIAIFVDKTGSAIDRLAQAVKKHNSHFDIRIMPIHPKRNDMDSLFDGQGLMKWADLIDIHYWKSGEVLRSTFPVEFEAKPKIVCHFNPYDYDKLKWQDIYKETVVGNETIRNLIPYSNFIPYGVDLEFFKFNDEYTKEPVVMMSVNRIEGKKGVLEVARACKELGYKFLLVGRVSDGEYMQQVALEGTEFIESATDEILRDAYYKSAIHVCNSTDNFESGTLPILEAMACGVPVLTRNVGHVPDLYNGGNMVVREGKMDDIEDLKKQLKELMDNRELRLAMREKAYKTIWSRWDKKMARQFSNLYYKVLGNDNPLVSIIIPTFDRGETFLDCLVGAVTQDYPHYELIVVDSGNSSMEGVVKKLRDQVNVPVKYVRFDNGGRYTLAEARNRGVVESEGEYLLFCDDRLKMQEDAISKFMFATKTDTWFWGVKDDTKKDFIENFSFIRRKDLIRAGMFNERIEFYGGMSQEIRTRFGQLGFDFALVKDAKAFEIARSKSKYRKKESLVESKFILYKLYG